MIRKILERIILLGLIIYSLFVTTSTSLQVGGICLGILALIPLIFFEHKRLKDVPFNIPILCFIVSLIISSLLSDSPILSLERTESIIRKILLYYLVVMAVSDIKWAERLIYILLVSGAIGTIIKWQFGLYENIPADRGLGGALGMMLPLSICIFWFKKNISQRICFGVVSFILLTLLLLTLTRGAFLGVLVTIIFIGILKEKKLLLLIPLFLLYGSIFPSVTNRAILTFNMHYKPNLDRIYIWKWALKTIPENPIVGIGPSFKIKPTASSHSHCHNNLLNVAVSCGLFGLFAFVWLLIEIFRYSIKAVKDIDCLFFLKLGIFGSLIDWFIHGLFDTTYLGRLGYLFWFLLGLMVVLRKNESHPH